MSSFEAPKSPRTRSRVAVSGKRPPLVHRSSDPEFSDAELDDAVDMGETAGWATLEEPIYVEKHVEIFRPTQKESSLPIYYASGRFPFAADTLFDALLDARYRKTWDSTVQQLYVIEHEPLSDVLYCALHLPWPLAHRDYVYRRRVKYYAASKAFVVLYQAAHHATAPLHATRVRVETCRLKLCIQSVPSAAAVACDFHLEYEDDTNFSIPNYGINLLLRMKMPSFLTELRTACAGYDAYIATLDAKDKANVPSRVVRLQTAALEGGEKEIKDISIPTSQPARSRPVFSLKKRKLKRIKKPFEQKPEPFDPPVDTFVPLKSSSSAENLSSSVSEFSRDSSSSSTSRSDKRLETGPIKDEVILEMRKLKRGRLHVAVTGFSNQLRVVYYENNKETGAGGEKMERGMLLTSINGATITDRSVDDVFNDLRKAPRSCKLGFTHPERVITSRTNRRAYEPPNLITCRVSRDEKDIVDALRPLNPKTGISAVLQHHFVASPATLDRVKGTLTSVNSSPALVAPLSSEVAPSTPHLSTVLPYTGTGRVLVPAGYVVYQLNGVDVENSPFADLVELLGRKDEGSVITFKAGMALGGGIKKREPLKNMYKISKRFPGVFQKKRRASDASNTTSISSTSSYEWPSGREASDEEGNVGEDTDLIDYAALTVTASNVEWVWQQVFALKATERLFSAGLLIDRLEAFVAQDTGENSTTITIRHRMDEERVVFDQIKARRDQGVQALREFNSQEGEEASWQVGQTLWGVTTSWKPDLDDGSVWIKLEGVVEGVDIFHTIAVIREVDLYRIWTPFCSHSLLLEDIGRAELAAYLAISSPLLQRDVILRAFGINAVYEHGCLLLLGQSVEERAVSSTVSVPKVQGWNAGRMEIKGFRAMIEPLSRMQARTCIVANINPKCALPRSMLNFGIKKIAGVLLYLIRKEAEKMAQDEEKGGGGKNEHLRRIEQDPSGFYRWLGPIIDKYFQDQSQQKVVKPVSWSFDAENMEKLVTGDALKKLEQRSEWSREHDDKRLEIESSIEAWSDSLYDVILWPYLVLFVMAKLSSGLSMLALYGLKFGFTCGCTWLTVPGAFPRSIRHRKRVRNELTPLRRQCLMVAALFDVLNSWALGVWIRWWHCYVNGLMDGFDASTTCFARSPLEMRDSMQFLTLGMCFLYASVMIGIQVVGKL